MAGMGEVSKIEIRVANGENSWTSFWASASVLSEQSEVLRAMLQTDCKETNKWLIEIEDFAPQTVYQFLNFLNGQQLSISSTEDMIALLQIADKYFVENLKQKCQDILINKIELQNVLQIYESVRLHSNVQALTHYCEQFIAAFFYAISTYDSFLFLHKDIVKRIISMNVLNVSSEIDVYVAVCRWSRQKCAEKNLCFCEKHIVEEGKELFPLVCFDNMTENEKKITYSSVLNQWKASRNVKPPRQKLQLKLPQEFFKKVPVTSTALSLTITANEGSINPENDVICLIKFVPKTSSTYLVGFRGAFYQTFDSHLNTTKISLYCDGIKVKSSPTSIYSLPEPRGLRFVDCRSYILDRPLKLQRGSCYTVKATFESTISQAAMRARYLSPVPKNVILTPYQAWPMLAGQTSEAKIPSTLIRNDESFVTDKEYFKIYGNVRHIHEICYVNVTYL